MSPDLEKRITQTDLLKKGYKPLTKKALEELISNTTVTGDYEYNGHRVYKTYMSPDGKMEAKNDWGSHLFGQYSIDENGYFSVTWEGYWDEWTGVAFKTYQEVRFYNTKNGKWITTFTDIKPGRHDLTIV